MNETYAQALTEVDEILKNISTDLIEKIPNQFKNFIKNTKSKNYKFEYNHTLELTKQNLKPQTKAILSLMYRNYWCTPEEKQKLKQQDYEHLKQIEQAKAEKYSVENIFKTKETIKPKEEPQETQQALAIVEESLWKRIINKIKKWFNR